MRSVVFGIIFFVLVISFVSAVETTIVVTAAPAHKIGLVVTVPDTGEVRQVFVFKEADSTGKARFQYISESDQDLGFFVIVKKGSEEVLRKEFLNYDTGEEIMLEVSVPGVESVPVVNTTNTTTSASVPAVSESNDSVSSNVSSSASAAPITGEVVSEASGLFDSINFTYVWYGLGGLVVVALLFFGGKFYLDSRGTYKPQAPSAWNPSRRGLDRELLSTEKKLKQAAVELEALKNKQNRMRDAERKFEEAKKELERARGW
ncbi:MAG TPA: hypothetical protein VJK51_04990 [Candidatus Nanoarchaeia archaeon]|nr:hypothetical protein [Candidatus Nanoarchaeia archaeon]